MLSLQQINKLRLIVDIPGDIAPTVDKDKPVLFKVNAFTDKVFTARLSRQAGVISSNIQSEAVEFDVPGYNGQLKPGMYAEVEFPVSSSRQGYAVPTSAIVHSTKGIYVVTLNNGKTKFINVQEGINSHDSTEIFGQIEEGLKILAHPTAEMEEGTMIVDK